MTAKTTGEAHVQPYVHRVVSFGACSVHAAGGTAGGARQRRRVEERVGLAECEGRCPLGRDAAADHDVEGAGLKTGDDAGPGGRDIFDLDAHALFEVLEVVGKEAVVAVAVRLLHEEAGPARHDANLDDLFLQHALQGFLGTACGGRAHQYRYGHQGQFQSFEHFYSPFCSGPGFV